MTLRDILLLYLLLVSCFLALFLIFFLQWLKERTIRDKSTESVKGQVVDYRQWGDSLCPPIVEYKVNNKTYRQLLSYSWVRKGPFETNYPTDVMELRELLIKTTCLTNPNALPYTLKTIFPIGTVLTVCYYPKKPKLSFVERYTGLLSFFKWSWVIMAIILVFINLIFLTIII